MDAAGRQSPPWLDAEERAAWLGVAAIMFSLPAALDARLQNESGVTLYEYMVLSVLSEQPDRSLRMSEIAAGVSSSLSRLSHVAGRLERRGLLTKCRIPGPGRRTAATLTDAGMTLVINAAPGHVVAVREYLLRATTRTDLVVLRRLGAAVAERIHPDRPFLHGQRPSTTESTANAASVSAEATGRTPLI
jgi:DNA-binding MarR family transcriptional regulator